MGERPWKSDSSPTGKSGSKRNRRKRKRLPKISLKDEKIVIRAAGDESYDSSEMSEIEFIKKRDQEKGKETVKDEDEDKAAFPVSAEKTRPWGMESLPSPPLPHPFPWSDSLDSPLIDCCLID